MTEEFLEDRVLRAKVDLKEKCFIHKDTKIVEDMKSHQFKRLEKKRKGEKKVTDNSVL